MTLLLECNITAHQNADETQHLELDGEGASYGHHKRDPVTAGLPVLGTAGSAAV